MSDRAAETANFDYFSSNYESDRNRNFYREIALKALLSSGGHQGLREGDLCVDLGCGTGISLEAAVAAYPTLKWNGVDSSAEMLKHATAKTALRGVPVFHSSADKMPFADHTIAWITCFMAYHWMGPNTRAEIERVLLVDGRLSLMVPLAEPGGSGSGNLWLKKTLARFRKYVKIRRSMGLRLEDLVSEFEGFQLSRVEEITIEEELLSSRELLACLESRACFTAIFGGHAAKVLDALKSESPQAQEPVTFQWKIGLVEARKSIRRSS